MLTRFSISWKNWRLTWFCCKKKNKKHIFFELSETFLPPSVSIPSYFCFATVSESGLAIHTHSQIIFQNNFFHTEGYSHGEEMKPLKLETQSPCSAVISFRTRFLTNKCAATARCERRFECTKGFSPISLNIWCEEEWGGEGGGMECFSFAHRVLIMTFMAKLGLNVSRGFFFLVPLPPF